MKSDMALLLAEKMRPVIDEYQLKIIRVDGGEALIVSPNYALRFIFDRDSVDISYIDRDSRSRLNSYTLRPLFLQRLTPEDSARYGYPKEMGSRLLASLCVYASVLSSKCRDVLGGDKSWLKRDAWLEGNITHSIERLLEDEL